MQQNSMKSISGSDEVGNIGESTAEDCPEVEPINGLSIGLLCLGVLEAAVLVYLSKKFTKLKKASASAVVAAAAQEQESKLPATAAGDEEKALGSVPTTSAAGEEKAINSVAKTAAADEQKTVTVPAAAVSKNEKSPDNNSKFIPQLPNLTIHVVTLL